MNIQPTPTLTLTSTPTLRLQPITLYTDSVDRMINHALVQRPITSRPQPMFPCHCKHVLHARAHPHQYDSLFESAMDRNNN